MTDTQLTFTEGELEALRGMVTDLINERITEPPYPQDFTDVIEKLDLPAEIMTTTREPLLAPLTEHRPAPTCGHGAGGGRVVVQDTMGIKRSSEVVATSEAVELHAIGVQHNCDTARSRSRLL